MFSSLSFRGPKFSPPLFTLQRHVVQKPFPPQACSIDTPWSSAICRMVLPASSSTVVGWPAMWNVTFGKEKSGKWKVEMENALQ